MKNYLSIIVVIFVPLIFSQSVHAYLKADAEGQFSTYDYSDDSGKKYSATEIQQRYSIMHGSSGKIIDKRFGRYSYNIGYQFLVSDSEVNYSGKPENINVNDGKIMFNGDVVVDPKEVPFRFKMYSRDNNGLMESREDVSGRGLGNFNVITRYQGRQNISSGATLMLGVKNGMTNGYNEIFRHFPMVLLDYRDDIRKENAASRRNLNSGPDGSIDTRLSRLAFVSLNKKDNWFHYRKTRFTDYKNHGNDYSESQFQLGTVDHRLERRWTDFSNWIRISADGVLTTKEGNGEFFSGRSSSIDLNLYAIMSRNNWDAKSFNSFSRTMSASALDSRRSIPLFVTATLSSDTLIDVRVVYSDLNTLNYTSNKKSNELGVAGGYRLTTFMRSMFNLSQSATVEQFENSDNKNSTNFEFDLSTDSSPRFSRSVSLNAKYSGEVKKENLKKDQYSHMLSGSAFWTIRPDLNAKFSQSVSYDQNKDNSILQTTISQNSYKTGLTDSRFKAGSDLITLKSMAGVNWTVSNKLTVSLDLNNSNMISDSSKSNETQTKLTTRYSDSKLNIESSFMYNFRNTDNVSNNIMATVNRIDYKHDKSLAGSLFFSYTRSEDSSSGLSTADILSLAQSLQYTYFSKTSTKGLFNITENLEYSASMNNNNGNLIKTSLIANYYPVRYLVISGGSRYQLMENFKHSNQEYFASLGINFRLVQGSVDYTLVRNTLQKSIERKLTANLKKQF